MVIPTPEEFINQVRETQTPDGFFGCIVPTLNQITKLIPVLRKGNFSFIEICEISLRYYKPVPARIRLTDRMVAHTGYLVFARPIIPSENSEII